MTMGTETMSAQTTSTAGRTLREQLTGRADPDFTMRMLPGWERRAPDADDLAERLAALRQRCLREHRPDLYAGLRPLVEQAHQAMQQERALAYYAPAAGEDTLWMPCSVIASIRRSTDGTSLDETMARTIQHYGATPLLGDKRFIRFEREAQQRVQDGTVATTTVVYLTPVPGSRRRRALQLVATIARPLEVTAGHERLRQLKTALDLCVSTLTWVPRCR